MRFWPKNKTFVFHLAKNTHLTFFMGCSKKYEKTNCARVDLFIYKKQVQIDEKCKYYIFQMWIFY